MAPKKEVDADTKRGAPEYVTVPETDGASLLDGLLSKPRRIQHVAEPAPARTRLEQYGDAVVDAFSDPANEQHLLSQGYTLEQLQTIRAKHAQEGKWRDPAPHPRDLLPQSTNCECRCCGGDE